MELGVLNKIDSELNNSSKKNLIKIMMMRVLKEKKAQIFLKIFSNLPKNIKLQLSIGLVDRREYNYGI